MKLFIPNLISFWLWIYINSNCIIYRSSEKYVCSLHLRWFRLFFIYPLPFWVLQILQIWIYTFQLQLLMLPTGIVLNLVVYLIFWIFFINGMITGNDDHIVINFISYLSILRFEFFYNLMVLLKNFKDVFSGNVFIHFFFPLLHNFMKFLLFLCNVW